MTATVGSYEAKTHLPALISRVEAGEEILITRNGKPVARLVGVRVDEASDDELLTELRAIRATVLPGPSVREMIDEGRR